MIAGLQAGANEYLMKPFNKDVLVAKLNLLDVLSRSSACRRSAS